MAKVPRTNGVSTIKPLLALGYTQAQLSRMFQVDTCTTSVWVRTNRVGERCVGRVRHIPELKGRVTPEALRPDLDEGRMRVVSLMAKEWDKAERDVNRPKETPGERKPGTGVHDSPRGGVQVAVRKRASKRKARGDSVVAAAVAAVDAADTAVASAPRRKRATKRSADAAGVGVAADAAPRRKRPSRRSKQQVTADVAAAAVVGADVDPVDPVDAVDPDDQLPLPGMDAPPPPDTGDDDSVTFA